MARRKSIIEDGIEAFLFNSRWLLAPFYIGLVLMLAFLIVVFARELWAEVPEVLNADPHAMAEKAILLVLSLIDLSLTGNLVLIVTFSGYENFVSKIDTGDNEDRPSWMGKLDFSALKIRVIASIVAISAIALLKAFMELGEADALHPYDYTRLAWLIVLHLTFIASGVLLAFMDVLTAQAEAMEREHDEPEHGVHGG
jgi:uncharacterized protein (TIGR00645 family)